MHVGSLNLGLTTESLRLGGVWIVSKQIVMSCLCLQVYISQMRRGSSDCDQVPRRTEFHEHKQLEASCKQKTLLTCKSTHKDNKYLSKIQLFICGNIWPIFLHKKKSIFEFDDYSKKCFLDISNNFTVERSPFLLFFQLAHKTNRPKSAIFTSHGYCLS